MAAEILYRELAAGQALAVAITKTVSGMRAQGCRDWHLLRVFVGDRMPGALVTGKMKRKAQKKMSFAQSEFLDVGTQTVKVAATDVCGTAAGVAGGAAIVEVGLRKGGAVDSWDGRLREEQCGGAAVRSVGAF